MKKIIKKFWGIGIIIVLLSTLFVTAVPVSAADPLAWNFKVDSPSAAVWGLAPGTDINDLAVDSSGMTMYAAVYQAAAPATYYLLQSTFGGGMWNDVTARLPVGGVGGVLEANDIDTIDYVAIAPDDANTVVVVDASSDATNQVGVAISTNGGATFSSMGSVGVINSTQISGVAISPIVTGNFRYIAVYGTNTITDASVIYYYNYGVGVGSWQEAVSYFTGYSGDAITNKIAAFAFSPNFPSDYIAVAISAHETAGGGVLLHALSFNSLKWDVTALGVTNYPVSIYSSAAAITVTKASLALLPDYDGGDESLRIAFVGAAITDTAVQVGGIWRCYDNAASQKIYGTATAGFAINSLSTDGTNMAAGLYDSNNVIRSADVLASAPTFFGARNLKKIGIDDAGNDQVIVKFAGATLYGAKRGDGSAVSKSIDYGNVWNDYGLMDSGTDALHWIGNPAVQAFVGPGTITDIYMSATGDPWYVVANDATKTSIYRVSMFAVTRVLCIPLIAAPILRGVPSDGGVVYAGSCGAADLYYTADGGTTRWYKRTAPANISDMAVESKETVYIGGPTVNIYKSTNSGFTWGLPVNCKFSTGAINTMLSLSAGNLLVGSTTGGVNYSTDGGTTWTATFGIAMVGGLGAAQVAASGLSAGNFIYAAGEGGNSIFRCEIGPANPFGEFKTMNMPAVSGQLNKGLMLTNGVLYALSANATTSVFYRTLMPGVPGTHIAPFWGTIVTSANLYNATPSALRVSSGAPGSIMLYAIAGGATIWYFEDNVALASPTLTGPADKALIQLTSALLGTSQNVNFTWNRQSMSTSYTLWIGLDNMFTRPVAMNAVVNSAPVVSSIVAGSTFQPGVTYYWAVTSATPLTSKMSEVRSFTVQQVAASVPSVSSPLNGATGVGTSPSFSWSPVSGTTKYEFQLSDTTNFDIAMFSEKLANTGIQPAGLALKAGKTYFWRVRAYEPTQGDWSSIANFTVAVPVTPPPPPVTITTSPPQTIVVTTPPPVTVILPTQPAKTEISPAYIWAIIIIGAVLVIAVIVLIVRTRRSV